MRLKLIDQIGENYHSSCSLVHKCVVPKTPSFQKESFEILKMNTVLSERLFHEQTKNQE